MLLPPALWWLLLAAALVLVRAIGRRASVLYVDSLFVGLKQCAYVSESLSLGQAAIVFRVENSPILSAEHYQSTKTVAKFHGDRIEVIDLRRQLLPPISTTFL